MFWLALVCWTVLQCAVILDWKRVRELAPAAMAGSVGSGLYLVVGFDNVPSVVTDTGPLGGQVPILLVLQIVQAPLIAMWYAQGLQPGARLPLVRTALFTGIALSQEWMATAAGRLVHLSHYQPIYSVLYYFGWFLMVWRLQTWLVASPHNTNRTASPEA